MKKNKVLWGLGVFILGLSPAVHATLLSPPLVNLEPGGSSFPGLPDDTTDSNGSNPIGTLVASTGVETINNTGATGDTLTGSFISEVYQEAGGTLDFYYQVSITSSTASLTELGASNFLASSVGSPNGVITGETGSVALFGTSGAPSACGFGANPACGAVSLTVPNYGTSVPFFGVGYSIDGTGTLDFDWNILPLSGGNTSVVFVVSTNDPEFELGASSLDGTGGTSQDLSSFEPLSAPEPVSLVLLGTALSLAALFIRRRHVAKVSKADPKS